MRKLWPYLLVCLIFSFVLSSSVPSHYLVNTHDEDDNIVSGQLMSKRSYVLYRDIFSHHLPGAYLVSEQIHNLFSPVSTNEVVTVHRNFIVFWSFLWALIIVSEFGVYSVWLIMMTELTRASYLYSLFQAENLVVYPMVYLVLTLLSPRKSKPLLSGFASGLITVMLSPLWPLIPLIFIQYFFIHKNNLRSVTTWVVSFLIPVAWVATKIDIPEFVSQFFGYNALTYAPLIVQNPFVYTFKILMAPVMVLFDTSLAPRIILIQILVIFTFILGFKKTSVYKLLLYSFILGVVGFRMAPRFHNTFLDFHVLPWIITLVCMCWYTCFGKKTSHLSYALILVPFVLYTLSPSIFFPTSSKDVGKMVIRYPDNSQIVRYLISNKKPGDTLFVLPAHTLLYQQTQIKPFNKFLFFLPWMEESKILSSKLQKSFDTNLPTYIFIDTINFPYEPPVLISSILGKYNEVKILDNQPSVYVLRTR